MAGWWREFETDAEAIERAIGRQHLAAIAAGGPWPPQRTPEPNPTTAPGPDPETSPEDEPVPEQLARDDKAARLEGLLARVAPQAAQRVAAQEAERQASSEYAARIEREAQTEPEVQQQAEVPDEAEIEL